MAMTTTPDEDASVVIEHEEGFGYAARHVDSGVSSQGETEAEALVALAEALALHRRPDEESREPTAEWYDRHGLSPADARSGDEPLPDFLR